MKYKDPNNALKSSYRASMRTIASSRVNKGVWEKHRKAELGLKETLYKKMLLNGYYIEYGGYLYQIEENRHGVTAYRYQKEKTWSETACAIVSAIPKSAVAFGKTLSEVKEDPSILGSLIFTYESYSKEINGIDYQGVLTYVDRKYFLQFYSEGYETKVFVLDFTKDKLPKASLKKRLQIEAFRNQFNQDTLAFLDTWSSSRNFEPSVEVFEKLPLEAVLSIFHQFLNWNHNKREHFLEVDMDRMLLHEFLTKSDSLKEIYKL